MPWLTRILYLFYLLSYTSESLNGTIIFDQVTVRLGFWVFYGLALLTWMVNLKHHHWHVPNCMLVFSNLKSGQVLCFVYRESIQNFHYHVFREV